MSDAPASARLVGREHEEMGALAVIAEGEVAIAISRGGAPKPYAHTDPNEDAVGFAYGPGGVLLAVADGHHGARGAERALAHVLEDWAPAWTAAEAPVDSEPAWREEGLRLLASAHAQVLAQAEELRFSPAPTTLSVALVRTAERSLIHASVGDSHVFRADGAGARDLAWASLGRRKSFFLGWEGEGNEIDAGRSVVDCLPLDGIQAIALASDGLSEIGIGVRDPAAAVAEAVAEAAQADPELRALEAARGIADRALTAHRTHSAGDNIATAVHWLTP